MAPRNPERRLLVWNPHGTYQLHAWDVATGRKRELTNVPGGQIFGALSSDGAEAYALLSEDGSEEGHVHAIGWESGEAVDLTPQLPPYTCFEIAVAAQKNAMAFVASLAHENGLVVIDRSTSTASVRTVFSTSAQLVSAALDSNACYTAVACSIPREDGKEAWDILLFSLDSNTEAARWSFEDGHAFPLAIVSGKYGKRVLVTTNMRGFEEPAWVQEKAQGPEFLQDHGSCDVYTLAIDAPSRTLLCCRVKDAKHTLSIVDHMLPGKPCGPSTGSFDLFFGGGHILSDGSLLLRHQSSTEPPSLLQLPAEAGQQPVCFLQAISPHCHPFESITFPTADGTPVQAWVARPREGQHPTPFVIDVHGGPNGVALDAFSPEAQAWLDHGVGYCGVNYRGSISFGKAFEQAIRGKPGACEVEDCIAARQELLQRGWALPDAILLSGWSWGGFITLLALGKKPQHWAAGIAAVPIADWQEQYMHEPPYLQAYDRELFGGLPEEVPERYKEASPITYVEHLQVPVLVIAGLHDSRCPIEQIERYIKKAQSVGKDIVLHQFTAGHTGAFGSATIGIKVFEAARDFLLQRKFPLRKVS